MPDVHIHRHKTPIINVLMLAHLFCLSILELFTIYNYYILHKMGLQICFPKSWKYVCILLIKTFLARYLFCCDHKQRHNKMLLFVLQITWLLLHTENTNKVKTKPKKWLISVQLSKKYYGIGHSFNFIEKNAFSLDSIFDKFHSLWHMFGGTHCNDKNVNIKFGRK